MNVVAEEVAKAQFEALLDRASHGEVIVVTRDGKPLAEISKPAQRGPDPELPDLAESGDVREARLDAAMAAIDRLSQKYADRSITLEEIREWINEGRR